MSEGAFKKDGKTFVAVDSKSSSGCNGCYFDMNHCVFLEHPCTAKTRKDTRRIVWKEKL